MTASRLVTAFAAVAFLVAPAMAQESHGRHAAGASASLSVAFSNGLVSVHAVGIERGHVLSELARQVRIRIHADNTSLTEVVTMTFQKIPLEIGIRRLVPQRTDLILIYATASGAERESTLSEVWLIPRKTTGDVVGLREREKAPPKDLPLTEPLVTLQDAPGDDPSTALSHLLAKLTDSDHLIRAAAVEALGQDAQAADALGLVLIEADVREAAASALGWLIDRSK